MSFFEERAARNEALFREINEHVQALSDEDDESALFICECGDTDCVGRLQVPIVVYEETRAHSRRFLVLPSHDDGFERVVEAGDGYLVVEKGGEAGHVADATDPRA